MADNPDQPLSDDDMETRSGGNPGTGPVDADSTDADADTRDADADTRDADADSTDADADADSTDADADAVDAADADTTDQR